MSGNPLGPVLTEFMSQKFAAVTEEMTINLKRASRSVYVNEAADFAVGLIDLHGHVFAFPKSTGIVAIDRPCGPTLAAVARPVQVSIVVLSD